MELRTSQTTVMDLRVYTLLWKIMCLLGAFFFYIPRAEADTQSFSVRPSNKSVIVGQSVQMECSIAKRVGTVQWAKSVLVLGSEPSLPGFPRYSIVQDPSDPELFNLQIVDTKLTDDAEYMCQVTPTQGQPPLSHSAFLTVLVPPELPVITGHNNGSVIDISPAETSMKLECVVRNGHPAAEIRWLKNGSPWTDNVIYSTVSVNSSKLQTAKSELTIATGRDQHDNVYTCQAKNDAIGPGWLQTFVKLNILSPPLQPTITGYTSGQTISAGDTLRLLCESRGGNPLAQVVWFKNNEKIDFSYNSGNGRSINEFQFSVEKSDNGAVFRCEASNAATQTPLTAEVSLNVYFPPESAVITGNRQAKAGETVTLTCKSSTSNPASVITWTSKGQTVGANARSQVESADHGGYTTTSEITITMRKDDDNVRYTCNAVGNGPVVQEHVTLSVLYPPEPPHISGYDEMGYLEAGRSARMTCRSSGGNPTATLTWYKGNQKLPSISQTSGNMVTSDLTFIPTPADNNAIYKCTAENKATDSPLTDLVKLTVYFQPNRVNVTMYPPVPKAGEQLRLKCVSMSSNPPASIRWYKNTKSGNGLRGTNNGTLPGDNGGSLTVNYLDIIPSADDHDATYYCQALNVEINQEAADGIVLNVQFKPVFDQGVSPSKIEIIEDESRTVDMSARANPVDITYTLYKDNAVTYVSSFTFSNGILEINGIKRDHSGDYALQASNSEGSSFHNFTVNVLFKAEISSITSPVIMEEGESATLQCISIGNPMVTNMVRWTRPNFDMTKTKQTYEDGKNELVVYNLVRQDAGVFKCIADNYLGEPASAEAQLIIKFGPIINTSRQYSKAAGEHGHTVMMTCKANGAPDLNFQWKKDNTVLNSDNTKYIITKQKLDDTLYKSVLTVIGISKADYGMYRCVALGETDDKKDTFDITLDGTSKPDPPYDLAFVNSSHDSITFSWKPGFNGGLNQSFTVKYRKRGDSTFTTRHNIRSVGDVIILTLPGLKKGMDYFIDVEASNDLGTVQDEEDFMATTADTDKTGISPSRTTDSDTPVIIILVVCVVGIFLLALNIGLILFFVRRRKKRLESNSDSTSHTNTIELYGPSKEAALYPMTPSDDGRSYGTYEKNMDDLSDDFRTYELDQKSNSTHSSNMQCGCYNVRTGMKQIRGNCCAPPDSSGDEDIKRVFLPPPGYNSYTPTKMMDSPHMNHKTYLTDSRSYLDEDPNSQWRYEDPYRIGNNIRHKGTFDSDYDRGSETMVYEYDRSPTRHDTRPKSVTDNSDRSSRPSSRGLPAYCRATPPPAPPTRSSSKGATHNYSNASIPPLPARNYDVEDLPVPNHVDHHNRYSPSPGSVGSFSTNANVIPNPTYEGPSVPPSSRNHIPDDMRGHLV